MRLSGGDPNPSEQNSGDWSKLGELSRDPAAFFREVLAATRKTTGCLASAIWIRPPSPDPGIPPEWRLAVSDPRGSPLWQGPEWSRMGDPPWEFSPRPDILIVGKRLPAQQAEAVLCAAFQKTEGADLERFASLLDLVVRVPSWVETEHRLTEATADIERFAAVLDLTVLLHNEERFKAAAILLCNELAVRYRCLRVGFGWLEATLIKIEAVSHSEKVEARMTVLQKLAAAMEEACEQGCEIVLPRPEDSLAVDRDNRIYADLQKVPHLVTLPLLRSSSASNNALDPDDAETAPVAGALTLERDAEPFSEQELRSLRLICEQATGRLEHIREKDAWIGRRAFRSARRSLARIFGVEHTVLKTIAAGLSLVLLVLIFVKSEHRVDAPFSLEPDSLVFLSAPFAGFLEDSPFREGDPVEAGKTVFALDASELFLEQEQAIAEVSRFESEATQAEGEGNTAAMRIAQARLSQAIARLNQIEHRIASATVAAPFDGYILEGDLRERVNAPVEKGEILIRLARLSGLFAEAKVAEDDIRFVENQAAGRILFSARPDTPFAVVVERIEAVARADQSGNHIVVRCTLPGDPETWWRPGMQGIVKIDCGQRSLLWILTRRTIDRIRYFLW